MRILIADALAATAATGLEDAGFEVLTDASLKEDALCKAISNWNPDALVVRSTRVTAAHFAAAQALSLVVRAGAGINTIDCVAASNRGVFVSNCPGRNSVAVAELAMGLILAVDRHIADGTAELRAGTWNKARFSKAQGLSGQTLGILGMGGIGRALASRAIAFGMPVVAWSRSLTSERGAQLGVQVAETSLDVARRADILSVHVGLSEDTRNLVDSDHLAALGDDGVLINTARAEVVDSEALLQALDRGLRAGLDVFPEEPSAKQGPFSHALAVHPNVVGTHHIGASTQQAQQAVAQAVVDALLEFRDTGLPPNCVNLSSQSMASHMLIVRHEDQVGVLAAVLDGLRKRQINVQEMENRIFAGGQAAVARIQISGQVPDELLSVLQDQPHVLHCALVPLEPSR